MMEKGNTAAPDKEAAKHEPESKLECRASVIEFVINASIKKTNATGYSVPLSLHAQT